MIRSAPDTQTSAQILMQGMVQGQGVRPAIARLAATHQLTGTVCNSLQGVEIKATGPTATVHAFETDLRTEFADAVFLVQIEPCLDRIELSSFHIIDSRFGGRVGTTVPLDRVTCASCMYEFGSASDRRSGDPFISCAQCGPRYSILSQMPFDRASTAMSAFPQCERCRAEYDDPSDRRFHAQTISCPDCGPRCWATDRVGNAVAGSTDAIGYLARRIAAGDIVAIKGIGGYQLVCDATNDASVETLRNRKGRPRKPLAVMVRNLDQARRFASISTAEQKSLQSTAGPIVVLEESDPAILSRGISPDLHTVGVMLPSSAMHAMFADAVDRPLVVTSGNRQGAPLVYQNEVAQRDLAMMADAFLHHDREIVHPVDDSVVQCVGDQPMTLRAARGIAPLVIRSPPSVTAENSNMLATGGHQKNSLAFRSGDGFVLAPHIGDLETEPCRVRFVDTKSKLQKLYQTGFSMIAHDRHPDYFTTDWALRNGGPTESVPHHHAHVAAAMLDHGLLGERVLGIAFDGSGYGIDATIWGGEAILADDTNFERVGHLLPFRLPGGAAAIRQPWRIAASLWSHSQPVADDNLRYAIDQGTITTSMGRLFDGVASRVMGIESVHHEGDAAMQFEAACDRHESSSYEFAINETSPAVYDWRPVLKEIDKDLGRAALNAGVTPLAWTDPTRHSPTLHSPTRRSPTPGCLSGHGPSPGHSSASLPGRSHRRRIAMKCHRAVANLVCRIAAQYRGMPCVLSGGVFQNRVLNELIAQSARQRSLDIRMPGRIPVNDGGLAIGQLVIANQRVASCV